MNNPNAIPAERAGLSFTPSPIFYPSPNVGVSMSTTELPTRYPLILLSEESDGLLFVGMVFKSSLTAGERARWVRHAAAHGEVLSPELAEQVAVEILRRDAQGAEEVAR